MKVFLHILMDVGNLSNHVKSMYVCVCFFFSNFFIRNRCKNINRCVSEICTFVCVFGLLGLLKCILNTFYMLYSFCLRVDLTSSFIELYWISPLFHTLTCCPVFTPFMYLVELVLIIALLTFLDFLFEFYNLVLNK